MNRLSRVFLAGLVMAFSLIMPVGAWDKYSFVGDSVYFSGQDAVLRDPAVSAEEESSSSVSADDFYSLFSASFDTLAALILVHHPENDVGVTVIPAWDELRSSPANGISCSGVQFGSGSQYYGYRAYTPSFNFEQNLNSGEFDGFKGIITEPYSGSSWNNYLRFDLDLSSFGDFSAFSLSGRVTFRGEVINSSNRLNGDTLQLYVDGRLVHTFYSNNGSFDFSDYIYSSSASINEIYFVGHVPEQSFSYSSGFLNVVWVSNRDFPPSFSVLSGDSVLDGYVDDAQDSINDWDSIESEFGSDATEGFNGLDLDNFTYPSDFLAAFSLVSGIFTDLWNCMGDFQIIYLLPLTLGICLLLVGRVSRSSVPSPPPLHTDLPVSNSLGPPSRPALKGGKR